jgi:sugar transferase EpsL
VEQHRIEEVIVTTSTQTYADILELVADCAALRVHFKLVPRPYEVMIGGAQIDRIDDIPLVEIRYRPLLPWNRMVKRTADLLLSAAGLILTAPLTLSWEILRRLKSERYRVVKQTYRGMRNKPITLKTRRIASRTASGQDRFRQFHRRWALGRVPQLYSILKGDLSLVGPELKRPDDSHVPVLKPGMTGFVQIHRHEGLTAEEVQEYEIYYLRNQSLMLDLQILWKAFWNLLRGSGEWSGAVRKSVGQKSETVDSRPLIRGERIEDERIRSRI